MIVTGSSIINIWKKEVKKWLGIKLQCLVVEKNGKEKRKKKFNFSV
jgi:hypothetical protein